MPHDKDSAIAGMNFARLAGHLAHRRGQSMTTAEMSAVTLRLYQIAMIDNYIPDANRESASKLLEMMKETGERGLAAAPELLKQYREANAEIEAHAKKQGVGSLAWMIREKGMVEAEMLAFLGRPEHTDDQLDDFYSALSPESRDWIKNALATAKTSKA